MVTSAPAECRVTTYAQQVLDGAIPAGRLVRLACERHLRDLETGHQRGLWFDNEAATRAIAFFGFLRHSKGEWAGRAFELSPWQEFVVGSVFGWKREDGTRRFRTAYNEVPRKNGKSTLSAGVGLYLAFFDNEPGAEVYAAATKRDQARIVWDEARRMVEATPQLRSRISVLTANLHSLATHSKFEPLGADADTLDGLNIHGAIVDELHAHRTRAIVDVLETATGSRRQPLIWYITTAGYDRTSVCWEHHDYSVKVLEGVIEDDRWFAYIATIDPGDDWRDPSAWAKANPNLGVSVKFDDLETKAARAEQVPGQQNAFRRLHLNEWTEQADRWLDMDVWDAGAVPVDPEALRGRPCFAGLDLSSTTDLTAFVAVFPDDDGGYDVLCRFWCPAEGIRERARRDRVPYDVWAEQGYLTPTEGNVVDYDHIREEIREFAETYQVVEIPYDRWNATQLVTQLMSDGARMVPFGQGFASMAAPTAELERLIRGGKLRHGGHPILRWMASNVAVEQDPAGNLKPSKRRSTERIDGIVALIMAIGRAMVHQVPGDEELPSVW